MRGWLHTQLMKHRLGFVAGEGRGEFIKPAVVLLAPAVARVLPVAFTRPRACSSCAVAIALGGLRAAAP